MITCKTCYYGTKYWLNSEGMLHRDNDLPAIENSNRGDWSPNSGLIEIFTRGSNNKKYRIRKLIPKTFTTCNNYWYVNGKLHRDGGLPAIEITGRKECWVYNNRHRDNGLPAIEYADGNKKWYENEYSYEEICDYYKI